MTLKKPQQSRAGGCGLPQRGPNCPKARIVNGTQSCYGQFPWQVRHFVICSKFFLSNLVALDKVPNWLLVVNGRGNF